MSSPRFSINKEQWQSITRAAAKYTAPLLLLFLVSIQAGTPVKDALWLVYGAGLQLAINFLTKFIGETK
jgi:hypothetical protein